MQNTKLPLIIVLGMLFGLDGCKPNDKGIPEGGYRFQTDTTTDHDRLIIQNISFITTSNRKIVLAEPYGATASTIGPSSFEKEKNKKAEIDLVISIVRKSSTINEKQIVFSMVIKTSSGTAYSQESMPISDQLNLSDIIKVRNKTCATTERMTIIRAEHEGQFIEVFIE